MAKKRATNGELAEEFVSYVKSHGGDVFKQLHLNGIMRTPYLHILPAEGGDGRIDDAELRDRVQSWLVQQGIYKTQRQATNIARAIRELDHIEVRPQIR
jgi:hypothetical protein